MEMWRVGWIEETGETVYSVPMDNKVAIGELCKSVETYGLSPTCDVWIETAEVEWVKIG
jgi:hypothetical protein